MQMTPNQLLQRTPIRVDSLVSKSIFPNRSRAIQAAVSEKLARMERGRLASKYAMLDPKFEKALAEEGSVRAHWREAWSLHSGGACACRRGSE